MLGKPNPFIVIITGPSGSGKTTICQKIVARNSNIKYSISATTRKPRCGEVHGKDYYFLTHEEFMEWVKSHKFYEWAQVYDDYYGTPREPVQNLLSQGYYVIMDLDLTGAKNVKNINTQSVTVFIMPPSLEELERRMRKRGDDINTIAKRLRAACEEIRHFQDYDYVVLNETLDKTVELVEKIIEIESLRTFRYKD